MSFNTNSSLDDELAPLAEINVTPLVDVMLVLLIIFMVTAPMLSQGMNVDLPRAQAVKPTEPQRPIVVSVGEDGAVAIGGNPAPREQIAAAVKALMGNQTPVVHIRGDRKADYGDVVAVLDELAASGISRLSLIARRGHNAAPPQRP